MNQPSVKLVLLYVILLHFQEPIDNIKGGLTVFDVAVLARSDSFLCISDFISFCMQLFVLLD